MNELDQFLQDFYDKYAPGTFTPEKGQLIKQIYGEDYDGLINDLYTKYKAPIDPDKLSQIKQLYKLAPVQQQPKDTGFLGAMKDMVQAAQTPRDPNAPEPIEPFMNAIERGGNLAEQADLLPYEGGTPTEEQLGRVAELQRAQQALSSSAAYQRFNSAESFSDALNELVSNPGLIISELTAESLSGLAQHGWDKVLNRSLQGGATGAAIGSVVPGVGTAAGLTGGAGAGAVVGMGETSLGLEYTGAFLESLQEAGVNTSDKESLVKAFADDNIISEARNHALKKGIPIAIFDMISGGVAGRIVTKPAKSLVGKIGKGLAELGVQSGLGAAGETAGQLTAGEELQPGAILAEAVGELGTTPVEVGIGAATFNRNRSEDAAFKDAEAEVDGEPMSDPTIGKEIDDTYGDIIDRLDAIDFDANQINVDELAEDIKSDIEVFSVINEENELPDEDFTSGQAERIQAQGPLPSSAQQELNLDDSEATPAINKYYQDQEQFGQQESERIEFESLFTPEQLDEMSNEEEFLASPEGKKYQKEQNKPKVESKPKAVTPVEPKPELKVEQSKAEKRVDIKDTTLESGKAAKNFEIEFPDAGTATGTIVGDKASIIEIYAATDEKGEPKRGGRLYNRVIEELKAQGVKQIVVGMQSEGSTRALRKLTEDGVLSPNLENNETTLQGDPVRFDFSEPKRKRTKAPIDPEERKKDLIVKFTKQLENIKKDKPGKQAKRLEILNEATLDLPEVNEKVREQQNKLKAVFDEKEFAKQLKSTTPEERLNIISLRSSPKDRSNIDTISQFSVPAKDESKAFEEFNVLQNAYEELSNSKDLLSIEKAEIKGIYERIKKEYDKALEPRREAEKKALQEQAKQRKGLQQQKDDFLTAVAKAVELNNPVSIESSVKAYSDWRASQNLKPSTAEDIKRIASAEFYVNRAQNQLKKEAMEQSARDRRERELKAAAEKKAKGKGDINFMINRSTLDELLDDTNKKRAEQGLTPLSKEQFINLRKEIIEDSKKTLGRLEQRLADIKKELDEGESRINEIKAAITKALDKGFTELVDRNKKLLDEYQEYYDIDSKLDQLMGVQTDIERTKVKILEDQQLLKDTTFSDNLKDTFGLSEDADIKPIYTGFSDLENPLAEQILEGATNVERISLNQLLDLISKVYPTSNNYLKGIFSLARIVDAISKKTSRNGLEIYTVNLNNDRIGGFHTYDDGSGRELLVINTGINFSTGQLASHEIIHAIIHGFITAIASTVKAPRRLGQKLHRLEVSLQFRSVIRESLHGMQAAVEDMFVQISRKIESDRVSELTEQEKQFLTLLKGYVTPNGLDPYIYADFQTLWQDARNEREKLYFLYDEDELLAEAFSNPYATGLLSIFEAPKSLKTSGVSRSFFRQLYDGLLQLIKDLAKVFRFTPADFSYFDAVSRYMEQLENSFVDPLAFNLENVELPSKLETAQYREFHAMINPKSKRINPLTPELTKLINYIANTWYKREDIVSEEAVQREVDKINAKSKKNKLDEGNTLLIWRKIQKYRQELADAKVIQANAKDYAKTHRPEYKTSKAFKRDVDDFAAVDLDQVKRSEMKLIQQGIIDLVMGQTPDNKAYNVVNKTKAKQYLERLLPLAGKYSKNPGVYLPYKLTVSAWTNPATYTSILARYNTKAAQELFNTIYGGMLEARTNSQLESNAFLNQLFELGNKYKLTHSDFVRSSMYGATFSTQLAPTDPEYWSEVELNLSNIVRNAQNKLRAFDNEMFSRLDKNLIEKEIEIAKELHSTILKRRDMRGILTHGQQEIYDAFRNFATKYEDDMMRNTEGVWGNDFKRQYNYFPTFALGRVRTADFGADELIPSERVNNLWEALQNNKNYGKLTSRQSGFSKAKVQPEGYFYDYDLISIAHKFAPSMLFDLYATRELKILNQLLNGAQGKPVKVDGQTIDNVLSAPAIKGLNRQLRSIVGGVAMYDADMSRAFKWFQNAKNSVAAAMLATTGQFLVQTSSAFPASLIMSPTGFPKAMKVLTGFEQGVGNFEVLRNFLDENGLSIQLRDVLFERWQTVEDLQKEGLMRYTSNWKVFSEKVTSAALRRGDKFAARLVWFSEYFAQGGTLEKPSRDAILAAERAVGLLQNMSDVSFSAPVLRTGDQAQRILMQMLYAFKSFALNAAFNTLYSAKYSITTNNKEARQVFLASLAMAAAYHAVSTYMIRPGYNAVANRIFGTDDDSEEEKNFSKEEEFAWNYFWDLFIGQWSPELINNFAKLGLVRILEDRAERNYEDFDPKIDLPLYAPRTPKDVLAEGTGVYGDVLVTGVDVISLMYESMDALATGEEMSRDELLLRGVKDAAMFMKHIPMRGDLQKLLRNYERKMKAEARQKGSSTGVEIEEVGTGFELPTYEIEIPEDVTELPEIE